MRESSKLRTVVLLAVAISSAAVEGWALTSPRKLCEPAQMTYAAPRDAFDFLIGKWDVETEGTVVARVEVGRAFEGKVLELRWKQEKGSYQAHSYLGLDESGRWSQTWVDSWSTPFFLFYHGGVEAGVPTLYQTEMYHESSIRALAGKSGLVCPRQRFISKPDGTFTYLFEVSTDQGKTWAIQDESLFRPTRFADSKP